MSRRDARRRTPDGSRHDAAFGVPAEVAPAQIWALPGLHESGAGNQAVQRLLRTDAEIDPAGSAQEQQAEQIAEQVTAPAPPVARRTPANSGEAAGRNAGRGSLLPGLDAGTPLDSVTHTDMERRI